MTVGLFAQRQKDNVPFGTPAEVHLLFSWGRSLGCEKLRFSHRGSGITYYCTYNIMAITKAKKETILGKLETVKSEADSIVFVKFNGMTVAADRKSTRLNSSHVD